MFFSRLLNWCTREKLVVLVASLALAVGAISPWYRLPPAVVETFDVHSIIPIVERILVAVLAGIGVLVTFGPHLIPIHFFHAPNQDPPAFGTPLNKGGRGERCKESGANISQIGMSRCPRSLFWGGLVAVLLFPYMLSTGAPKVVFLSHAYEEQTQRVTRHVEANFDEVQAFWKQNILLNQSRPIASTVNLPIQDSRFFQLPSLDPLITEGLGFNNEFFQFLGKGWGWAVIGICFALLGLYLAVEQGLDCLWGDAIALLPWGGVILGVVLVSLLAPQVINYQIDTLFAQGKYAQVINLSQTLATWHPPFQGDEAFLKRMAEAGWYAGNPDAALLSLVRGLEYYRHNDFLRAESEFRQSLELDSARFLTRGYLATTLLNRGIQDFNHSKAAAAPAPPPSKQLRGTLIDLCTQALQVFPDHLEALYYLMLAHVVNGDFAQSASVAQRIIDVQAYSQDASVALLGQTQLHLAWAEYHKGDLDQAWSRYHQALDPGAWKKSDPAKPTATTQERR